jgi:hypothetical protein
VIFLDLMNTPWATREYIANRIVKVLSPLEKDEGIYLYLLTPRGEFYPVRPKGTGQAAAIEQGGTAGGGGTEKPKEAVWTKSVRALLMEAIKDVHGLQQGDPETEAWRAPFTFRRLSELQDDFYAVRGPKTLLWISGGVPVNVPSSCENDVISSATGTYASGVCSGSCQLPTVAGMSDILKSCMDFTPFVRHFSAEAAGTDMTVSSVAVTATGLEDFEVGKAANTMTRLAELTGGQVYVNTDADLEKAIREAMEARASRYRLTFAGTVEDGKYHKLQVSCRRAGVRVVGPRGYFAGEKAAQW